MDSSGSSTPPSPLPDREPSPDWLRTFQTPLKDYRTLSFSSDSSSSLDTSAKRALRQFKRGHDDGKEEEKVKEMKPRNKASDAKSVHSDGEDIEDDKKVFSTRVTSSKGEAWHSSRREGSSKLQHHATKKREEKTVMLDQEDSVDFIRQTSLPKDEEVAHEDEGVEGQERRTKRVLSSLPLVFGDKVHRTKVLLECEGDALDVSGDVGAVGRLRVPPNSNDSFLLDLKGVIYKGTVVPSNTFFVVNIGQSEAKVEAIMNDFVQLQPNTNVFETETMVEGTLEGFGFDTDDDKDYGTAPAGKTNTEPKVKKTKSEKPLKVAKAPIKKSGKAGTSRSISKGGGTRKSKASGRSMKKLKPQKRGK